MRILILSDSDSPHTVRWAKGINEKNITVAIFSIHKPNYELYKDTPNIFLFSLNLERELQFKGEASFSKLYYLKAVKKIKEVIRNFKPDILHSHYASSYGFIGALTGFHPYIISVWGSDVYNFPHHSLLHKILLKFNLYRTDKILSTSKIMREETKKYTSKDIIVIPFGIDLNRFKPNRGKTFFDSKDIVIGTVKTLEKKYGIDYLIYAFKLIKDKFPLMSLKLLIVGRGSQEKKLKGIVNELNIQEDVLFTGYINHDNVQDYHNMIDINVSPSIEDSESFGVAVLEACACGKPVIVSDVGGLPEVVDNYKTGLIVQNKNANAIAEAIEKLLTHPNLREELGKNGRVKVVNEYNWDDSVHKMIAIYHLLL